MGERDIHTLCGVTFRAGDTPKAAVKVATRGKIRDSARAIEAVERAEEGQRGDGTVEEARVRLAKGVACEDARGLLQAQDDCIYLSVSHKMHREGAGRARRRTVDCARHVHAREGFVRR